jgi:hypothetical protein
MKDYILYVGLMVIGACMWNIWAYIKYLEMKNDFLIRKLAKEKSNDSEMAAWTGDSGRTPE